MALLDLTFSLTLSLAFYPITKKCFTKFLLFFPKFFKLHFFVTSLETRKQAVNNTLIYSHTAFYTEMVVVVENSSLSTVYVQRLQSNGGIY